MSKMSLWEKFSYLFLKKDPTKKDVYGKSNLEKAVKYADMERLNFWQKHTKIRPEALTDAISEAYSGSVVNKLVEMGGRLEEMAATAAANRIVKRMLNYSRSGDFEDNVPFLRTQGVRLTYAYEGRSLYDAARDKDSWFKYARPDEIAHEFRQAVADGKIKKVQEMLEVGKDKVDVNAKNTEQCDAMNYALRKQNMDMIELLYQKGAKLFTLDASGKNAFQRATPEIQEMLIKKCLMKKDKEGLAAAEVAKCRFDKLDYLRQTNDPAMLEFLARRGAPIDAAIREANDVSDAYYGTEEHVARVRQLTAIKTKLEIEGVLPQKNAEILNNAMPNNNSIRYPTTVIAAAKSSTSSH